MSHKIQKHRAKQKAKEIMRAYSRNALDREDLIYQIGLTPDEADRVFQYLVTVEKEPQYTHFSHESGGEWRVPISEKRLTDILYKDSQLKHKLMR